MKTKRTAAILAALVVSVTAVPAWSEQTATSSLAQAKTCPAVQMIAINDVDDSALGQADAGFLADVAAPVLIAANGPDTPKNRLDGGFSAPTPSSAPASETQSWKPDVWGESTATSLDTTQVPSSPARESSASPTAAAFGTTTEAATPLVVGRTVIDVESTNDTRAYLPGLTGPDTVPNYEESITTAVDKAQAVLSEIDTTCPETKVVLLGVGQGAQAASIVSKKIGAGEVFPADKVLGVSLFADPTRAENQPVVASGAAAPAGAKQQWNAPAAEGAGVATVTGKTAGAPGEGYGAVADRTVSWCADGDTSCALPEGAPLRALVANTAAGTADMAPEYALRHVTDILAPAVVLGSVETLAEDVNFGADGFTFNRASSPDETLIGRIAMESDRDVPQSEMQQRLLAAGMKIGGMALAAGVTVAKEVLQPQNIAQIAAASAISPAAGVGAALLISGGAALKLVSSRTLTTGAVRLADEAQAIGIEDEGLVAAAVDAAIGQEVSKSAGVYKAAGAAQSGESSAHATTQWLLEAVGESIGRDLGTSAAQLPANFDAVAVAAALKELG